jgi:Family of unknown function (DUF6270)
METLECPTPVKPKTRVLIYGSCVSRDPVEAFLSTGQDFEIAAYISKTSLISQFMAPQPASLVAPEGSDFAARMIKHDMRKDASHRILTRDYDYLLIDLIDERLPLLAVDGSILTGSRFLYNAFPELNTHKRAIDLYSDDGRQLFATALRKLLAALKESGFPQDRVILHRAWWARTVQEAGQVRPLGATDLADAHRNNTLLAEAYRIIKAELPGCRTIEVDKARLVADAAHKWGAAPFHYIDAYHDDFRAKLAKVLWTPPRPFLSSCAMLPG